MPKIMRSALRSRVIAIAALLAVLITGYQLGRRGLAPTGEASAAGGVVESSTGVAADRYVYYPGTEKIGKDEIRLFACGTGMPASRLGQAATCWLVELGNGDKFLFDIGSGSMANVAALMIPYDDLDKVFLTHLHTDHWGDLDGLWAGGWTAGRTEALKVWGPSGARPEMGTKHALENFKETFYWDWATRAARLNGVPGEIEIHEFDYKGINQVVYEENGATPTAASSTTRPTRPSSPSAPRPWPASGSCRCCCHR